MLPHEVPRPPISDVGQKREGETDDRKGGEGRVDRAPGDREGGRSEEHTSELQSLMRISYAVFCLQNKTHVKHNIEVNYVLVNNETPLHTTEQHQNITNHLLSRPPSTISSSLHVHLTQ